MNTALQILSTQAQAAAVIPITIPRAQIQQVMGDAIGELINTLAAQGITPAGPLFSRHFGTTPEIFDFQVGFPIDAPLTPTGRVIPGELPATRVARTFHHGPYEDLGQAWGQFQVEIAAAGHTTAPGPWERYLTHPESHPDPATWRTELNQPLAPAAP